MVSPKTFTAVAVLVLAGCFVADAQDTFLRVVNNGDLTFDLQVFNEQQPIAGYQGVIRLPGGASRVLHVDNAALGSEAGFSVEFNERTEIVLAFSFSGTSVPPQADYGSVLTVTVDSPGSYCFDQPILAAPDGTEIDYEFDQPCVDVTG